MPIRVRSSTYNVGISYEDEDEGTTISNRVRTRRSQVVTKKEKSHLSQTLPDPAGSRRKLLFKPKDQQSVNEWDEDVSPKSKRRGRRPKVEIKRNTCVDNGEQTVLPKRGRPRLSIVKTDKCSDLLNNITDQPQVSEYELLNKKNKAENLSMLKCMVQSYGQSPNEWEESISFKKRGRRSNHELMRHTSVNDGEQTVLSAKKGRPRQSKGKPNESCDILDNQPQMSEYELLHKKRKEESLSMLKDLFSIESTSEKTTLGVTSEIMSPRKHTKRPLPPKRPPSLRLQGLDPNKMVLRKRYQDEPSQCICLRSYCSEKAGVDFMK